MENAFKIIGKFFFPVTCIILGLFFLAKGQGQTAYYTFGAIAVLVVGILSLLFVLDVIKRKILVVFTVLFLVGSGLFSYFNYQSIDLTMKEIAEKRQVKSQVIQGLKDMRTAQLAYLEKNGQYTEDLDELIGFVKTGTIPALKKIGTIPDSVGN